MSLIDKLPDFIAIKLAELNTQGQELRNIFNDGRKLLGKPRGVNWDEYDSIIARACKLMKTYDGRFENYFANSLKDIKVEEKLTLGYSSPGF